MAGSAGGAYEVIVVGAGHAGCEAALAAARMGRRTLLVTMNLDLVGQMPCNPSIGGSAKGQLVREIDALGGIMGRNTDRTLIQIRTLNTSGGPAVHALRAQADKRLYSLAMKHVLEAAPNLHLKQGQVEEILTAGDRVAGVRLAGGQAFGAGAVVIASGTFLNGRVLSGDWSTPAGRAGEFPAQGLSRCLSAVGLTLGRLQTNTPPRVDARTIHYDLTRPQYGSDVPVYFSFDGPPADPLTLPINPAYPIAWQTAWRTQVPAIWCTPMPRPTASSAITCTVRPSLRGAMEAMGPALLPLDRGKGRALWPQRGPPALSRAGGFLPPARCTCRACSPGCPLTCRWRYCAAFRRWLTPR